MADLATQFVIHPPALVTTAGTTTLDDLHNRTEALTQEAVRMRDVILARTRMTAAELDPMLAKATYIDPQRALAYGLDTEVGHLDRPASSQLLTLPMPNRPPLVGAAVP